MPNVEEFIKDCGKPKTVKEHIVYGLNWTKEQIGHGVEKAKEGIKWVVEHPQEAAVLATITTGALAVVKRGCKVIDRYATARRETYNKDRYVFDHSAGRWVKTSRKLKSDDVRRINKLRAEHPGMKMSEALEWLNLLD